MAQSPILTGAKCRLEPFADQHLTARYVGWLGDPAVVRHSEQRHRKHDLESCRAYAASFAGSPHYFWAIVANDPALGHIGNINAYLDSANRVADVGILVGERASWGKGFGTDAWLTACRFLLLDQNLRKVTAGTLANNHGMLAVMRHAGMREEGRRRRQALWEGVEVDMVEAGVMRDEFAAVLKPASA
ncbi:MAG: GNAT family N-acetyltransferase [Rhodospirillaceae bacterium]|nr:GNAT family N-acetyltransferase [Rhodospirillaceae bacterium]